MISDDDYDYGIRLPVIDLILEAYNCKRQYQLPLANKVR